MVDFHSLRVDFVGLFVSELSFLALLRLQFVPLWGKNYLEFDWFVPETGLFFALEG